MRRHNNRKSRSRYRHLRFKRQFIWWLTFVAGSVLLILPLLYWQGISGFEYLPAGSSAAKTKQDTVAVDTVSYVSFIFAGDVMGHMPLVRAMQMQTHQSDSQRFDFKPCYQYIKEVVSKANIASYNLETVLAGEPYKGFPVFSSPAELALDPIRGGGFNFVVTANNHACDKGKKGIYRTLEVLENAQILHTGTFRNQAERDSLYPIMLYHNKIKIAMLNYTYGTNGIAIPVPAIVNLLDTNEIKKDFAKCRSLMADAIVVQVHWGVEYARQPHRDQRLLADFFAREGALLVMGSHPHKVQPLEWLKLPDQRRCLVAYSMGNFLSNQRKPDQDGGLMVYARLKKDLRTGITVVDSGGYIPTWVYLQQLPAKKSYFILPAARYEKNDTLSPMPKGADRKQMLEFLASTRKLLNKNGQVSELHPDSLPVKTTIQKIPG
jgi:poly-gamma-glutamate synthesis protein (capsule biosynthesis protein)